MVADAQLHDALGDARSGGEEYERLQGERGEKRENMRSSADFSPWWRCEGWRRLPYNCSLVQWLDGELLVSEGDVSDFAPGETNLWCYSGEREKDRKVL